MLKAPLAMEIVDNSRKGRPNTSLIEAGLEQAISMRDIHGIEAILVAIREAKELNSADRVTRHLELLEDQALDAILQYQRSMR